MAVLEMNSSGKGGLYEARGSNSAMDFTNNNLCAALNHSVWDSGHRLTLGASANSHGTLFV
jgi:hypothetical protein